MPRTLYLHIGAHRTATTSIQEFLFANRAALRQRGILYPYDVRRHHALMKGILDGRRDIGAVAADLERRAASQPEPVHTIVLSDEYVCRHPDPSVLAGLARQFDLRIVYALRRQDLWLESWYLQNIKWQGVTEYAHLGFEDFLARRGDFPWIEYDSYVARLEGIFGAENVLPYAFERGQMPGGPVAAFCDVIRLTDRAGLTEPPHENSSLSPAMSEFLRCLPLDRARPDLRRMLTRACREVDERVLGNTGRASERILPHAQRLELLEEYAAGNRALARRRFGREELFLDPLPDPEAPVASLALPADSYTLMGYYVAPVLEALLARLEKRLPAARAGAGAGPGPKAGRRAGIAAAPKTGAKTGPKARARAAARAPQG